MCVLQKSSGPLSPKIKKQLTQLKNAFLRDHEMDFEEIEKLLSWIDNLHTSHLCCQLFEQKNLDGNWQKFFKAKASPLDDLLFSFPSLQAMRKRLESVSAYLNAFEKKNTIIAVYPASYEEEWSEMAQTSGFSLVGINDKDELLMNEAAFDIIIKYVFHYGDTDTENDIYHYLYNSLKPGGVLLNSVWLLQDETQKNRKEELFFEKLLGMPKVHCQTISVTKTQLRKAGFDDIHVLANESSLLRTLVAKKDASTENKPKIKRLSSHHPRRMNRKSVSCKASFP